MTDSLGKKSVFAAVVAVLTAANTSPAVASSHTGFECRKAKSWAEKAICGDASLSELDRRMADVYNRVGRGLTESEQGALTESQRQWLADRNACKRAANPLDCLRLSYEERLGALVDLEDSAVTEPPPVIRSTFLCEDGRSLDVAFHNVDPSRVVIVSGRRTIDLPQTVSASGARYSDGVTTFWNKGDQALFEWANGFARCRARQ